MRFGIRPERNFGAVKELQQWRAPTPLVRRSRPIPGIELVEIESLAFAHWSRAARRRAALVYARPFEQFCSPILVLRMKTQAHIALAR